MIKILTVGKLKDRNLKSGFDEYQKRIGRFARLDVEELKKGADVIGRLKNDDVIVALDENGENLTSESLAKFIKNRGLTSDLVFIVGGPDGLDVDILKRAGFVLSLSKMTFTSQITMLLLIEQIYRALTIINGVKYHR